MDRFQFLLLLGLIMVGTSPALFSEDRHSGARYEVSRRGDISAPELGFESKFQREILPNPNAELSIHLEDGSVNLSNHRDLLARRIYQGRQGSPNGNLDMLAVNAGKARTFLAAEKVCDKLVPLGQWRLATVAHVMAFFGDLLPGYPLPDNPEKRGYLFWAASSERKKDVENKEVFYTTPELGGQTIETQHFTQFGNYLRQQVARSSSKSEKEYYINFLKETRAGIPVLCVIGKEP